MSRDLLRPCQTCESRHPDPVNLVRKKDLSKLGVRGSVRAVNIRAMVDLGRRRCCRRRRRCSLPSRGGFASTHGGRGLHRTYSQVAQPHDGRVEYEDC